MEQTIMCGIDMHENSLVCRVAVNNEEPRTKRHGNTGRGRQQLFRELRTISRKRGGGRIVVAHEASTHGFCFYDDCRDEGIECFILAPTKMRKSKKDRKKKTDEHDAQLILETLRGHVLAGNTLPNIWIPDDQTREDREVVRARLDVAQKLTGVKTQIQTLLKGRRVRKPTGVGRSWSRRHRQWLASLCKEEPGWPALATLLRQIEALEGEIAILDNEIAALSRGPRYAEACEALVEEIVGVGVLTAMVFLTEMGDLSRFRNRRKVGAYVGLAPSSNDSGETERKGHITREGSWRVRKVLCQGSWARVAHDPVEARIYEGIVERNPKHKKIAVVAAMRRLGIRMWHVGLAAQQRVGVFPRREPHSTYARVA